MHVTSKHNQYNQGVMLFRVLRYPVITNLQACISPITSRTSLLQHAWWNLLPLEYPRVSQFIPHKVLNYVYFFYYFLAVLHLRVSQYEDLLPNLSYIFIVMSTMQNTQKTLNACEAHGFSHLHPFSNTSFPNLCAKRVLVKKGFQGLRDWKSPHKVSPETHNEHIRSLKSFTVKTLALFF